MGKEVSPEDTIRVIRISLKRRFKNKYKLKYVNTIKKSGAFPHHI
jgi:hypothetical protein